MADMKPILFNTEMVRGILEDRKTVTRRAPFQTEGDFTILKGTYFDPDDRLCALFHKPDNAFSCMPFYAPYQRGDTLYVRETYFQDNAGAYHYKADDALIFFEKDIGHGLGWQSVKWRPSIHMPKEAARIFLRVTDVRVERLQDITYEDCLSEGITNEEIDERDAFRPVTSAKWLYAKLWDSTIKPADRALYGWAANPWVWVIAFERVSRDEAGQ